MSSPDEPAGTLHIADKYETTQLQLLDLVVLEDTLQPTVKDYPVNDSRRLPAQPQMQGDRPALVLPMAGSRPPLYLIINTAHHVLPARIAGEKPDGSIQTASCSSPYLHQKNRSAETFVTADL